MKTGVKGKPEPLDRVIIYTDGSSSLKNGDGAWAFTAEWEGQTAVRYGYQRQGEEHPERVTNITAEMYAILRAMEFVRPEAQRQLIIHTDSEYSIKALTQWSRTWAASGWRNGQGKEVANKELIQRTLAAWDFHAAAGGCVTFKHVKGHSGIPGNERVDQLAGESRKKHKTRWGEKDAKFYFCAICIAYQVKPCPQHLAVPRPSTQMKAGAACSPSKASAPSYALRSRGATRAVPKPSLSCAREPGVKPPPGSSSERVNRGSAPGNTSGAPGPCRPQRSCGLRRLPASAPA